MKFAILTLAAFDKQKTLIEGGTVVAVNPTDVRNVQPVVIEHDEAGFPSNGVCQITYTNGDTALMRGTVREITNALTSA